jgi:hypothetical protein
MPWSRDRGIFYWAVIGQLTCLLLIEYISIPAVTAAYGFALMYGLAHTGYLFFKHCYPVAFMYKACPRKLS